MKIRKQFVKAIPLALLFACFGVVTSGQELAGQDLPTLSPPLHAALYPEVMCAGCIVPHWDHSYLLHVEFDRDPAVVTMYDRVGEKVLEGRMVPPDAVKASVRAAGVTQAGGIVAIGGGIMTDGSSQRFIVKSDASGRVVQSVRIADFYPAQVCEAADSTVWVLGYEPTFRYDPNFRVSDEERNVLRHYSFEKGLLGSFVSLSSISKSRNVSMQVARPNQAFLRCGKDRVAVLLGGDAAEYIEIDTSTEKLSRWRVVLPLWFHGKARGFAMTDEGTSFVSLCDCCVQQKKIARGLYELRANSGTSVATLVPVEGTVTAYDPEEIIPGGTFFQLWGADGNELVVQRAGDEWGLSWARVSASVTTSN